MPTLRGAVSKEENWMLMIALTCAASVASGSFEHILPLQTGEVRVEAMTRTARSAELARLSWQSDHPHAIVVLNHADAAADLTADGLTLLRSLGGSTWIAAVAPAAADSTRVLDAVSWIGAINPTWKVHSYLASGGVPDWTIDQSASTALIAGERFDMESLLRELDEAADPRVVVYILAHRDVSLDALAVDLPVLADAAVLSKLHTVHGLTVAIPMSAIVPLAEDDRVLWIEPAMPRFNELNDQNREVTQANDLQECMTAAKRSVATSTLADVSRSVIQVPPATTPHMCRGRLVATAAPAAGSTAAWLLRSQSSPMDLNKREACKRAFYTPIQAT
jgi:hypothetical protein